MQRVPMTVEGKQRLEAELYRLKYEERPRIAEQIASARELGDLKENAEYHAAREQQSFVEGRIVDLESKLSNAQVIDIRTLNANGRVTFGSTVSLLNLQTKEMRTFQIVGEDESDHTSNKISFTSPLARAVIGKLQGDEASVNTPSGESLYAIEKVQYV